MEMMSARELSRYLKINGKKVYALALESDMPSMRIGGKVTFSKELIDRWILR
jgi:putative molybdopterin biosynthesis protein